MTDKAIALITADNHLSPQTWAGRAVYGDSFRAFSYLVRYAIDNGIESFVCAGDLLDKKRPDSSTVEFLVSQLHLLRSHEVDFLYVDGNHDIADPPWSAVSGHGTSLHMHRALMKGSEVTLMGLNYQTADRWKAAVSDMPKDAADIFVGHQKFAELNRGGSCQGSIADIPFGEIAIVGDYHVHTQIDTVNSEGEDMVVLSPGSSSLQSIDEPQQKKFYVLYEDSETGELSFASEDIPSRPVLVYDLSDADDVEKLAATLVQDKESQSQAYEDKYGSCESSCPLVWFRYSPQLGRDSVVWARRLASDAGLVFFERTQKSEEPEEEAPGVRASGGGLPTILDIAEASELPPYAMSVLRSLQGVDSTVQIQSILTTAKEAYVSELEKKNAEEHIS